MKLSEPCVPHRHYENIPVLKAAQRVFVERFGDPPFGFVVYAGLGLEEVVVGGYMKRGELPSWVRCTSAGKAETGVFEADERRWEPHERLENWK